MKIDEIERAIRALSHADCERLFGSFNLIPFGTLGVEVTIEDGSKDKPPIAIVEYNDGSKKAIDIIATVQKNPKSIGHPVIRIAIWRWSEILRHHRALNFKDADDEKLDGLLKDIRKHTRGRFPDIAAKNLIKIHKALMKAPEDRTISREEAFEAEVKHYGLDSQDTYLYEAYEWLRQDKTRNRGLRLEKLEQSLQKKKVRKAYITLDRVLDFLRDEIGSSYIRPRSWIPMRNAFIAWNFKMERYTVRRYFSTAKAKKKQRSGGVDDRFLVPGLLNKYILSEAGSRFSLPVVLHAATDEDEESEGHFD